ncbi:hypothetical protein WICMUC_004572 [Wickerhamomyces mucosus]|uniref:Rab proteins geranylgeranyltransferase component A n=1 Tax=Wickerhamomyces mucosus TaxID=1378264 RepID=A0A9P8TAD3_9ASCO|nr:hypothetical protein WICMUC_004572 [Wickerhamomyces mucosus]
MSNRRPSMVERRSSINEYSTQYEDSRVSSPIPHLAGLEKPLPETIPEEVDVVIAGTGLVESILAAALSWQGSNVLHIDSNDYYGDSTATLTINQLIKWVERVNKGLINNYKNAMLYFPNNTELEYQNLIQSKDYGIDLTPKILFAKSDLLSLLIKSRVYKYLEFLPLSSFHFFENDNFEKMNNSKKNIFINQSISLINKRSLMKFIKFSINWENSLEIWNDYKKKSIKEFLQDKFKLELNQINELIFAIGLCNNDTISTPEALTRIKRYLISFDVYGNFPVMYSKYGGAGEISQGFCRSAAVAGTTYKLNTKILNYDPISKIAKLSDNSKVKINEKLIISSTQSTSFLSSSTSQTTTASYEIQRLTVIVKKSCSEWFENNESSAIVVFPTNSLKSGNKFAVQAIIMGENTEITSSNTTVWYLSTIETGDQGRADLESALESMEKSILRESKNFEEPEILSQSIKFGDDVNNNFKSGEKLQYLLKFYYIQSTSLPHSGVVNTSQYRRKNSTTSTTFNDDVLFSSLPSSEISYDGIITSVKLLYELISGSDDDFFDVDFEDEDEQDDNNLSGFNNDSSINDQINSKSINDDDNNEDDEVIDSEAVEFADDMEL